MSLKIDSTVIRCTFCQKHRVSSLLVRSMYGLYCTNEHCYSRVTNGNLVPPSTCSKCGENTFYVEAEGTIESAVYQCIACGNMEPI